MMTPEDWQALVFGVVEIAFAAGLAGAFAYEVLTLAARSGVLLLAELLQRRERIAHARMRHVHGPLLLPGAPRWLSRSALANVLRARAKAQGDLARACEGLGDVRPLQR